MAPEAGYEPTTPSLIRVSALYLSYSEIIEQQVCCKDTLTAALPTELQKLAPPVRFELTTRGLINVILTAFVPGGTSWS